MAFLSRLFEMEFSREFAGVNRAPLRSRANDTSGILIATFDIASCSDLQRESSQQIVNRP